jgi:5-methyltetrahydropteroyltriglutamate--homocysteine methyltransferase
MNRSQDRILTTHVGSLPRPVALTDLYRQNAGPEDLESSLGEAVVEVVRRQLELGLCVVNDGEFGKATRSAVDYGAWWSYIYDRLSGFEVRAGADAAALSARSKDRAQFREFYATGQATSGGGSANSAQTSAAERLAHLACVSPVRYTGQSQIARDLQHLAKALQGADAVDAFMTAVSPATLQILPNEYYKSQEDYTWALSEAISEEYRAIVAAGYILQIDDPAMVDLYDWWFSEHDDVAGYRRWAEFQV